MYPFVVIEGLTCSRKCTNLKKIYKYSSRIGNLRNFDMIDDKNLNTRNIVTTRDIEISNEILGRPFTLPSGLYKPKQSLGQNFLSDQNYVNKIVDAFDFNDKSHGEKGSKVIEIGPGAGALTRVLYQRYPAMRAIELDQRSIAFLKEKLPDLYTIHMDALLVDWPQLAADKGDRLNIIGNLPYYIVSQILFSFADNHLAINKAVLTMQLEVAERLIAKPSTKQYGIPSVIFQLYSKPHFNFKIPPNVFYPVPKVDSALMTLDFSTPNPALEKVHLRHLRRVITRAFNQRRKMLRQSLKGKFQTDYLFLFF